MATAAAAPAAAAPVAAVAAAAPAAAAAAAVPAAAAPAAAAATAAASGGNPDPHVRSPLSAHSNAPSSSAMSAGVTSADRAVDAFFGRALFARAASEGGDVSHLAPCLDDHRHAAAGRSPGGRDDHLSLPGTPSGATSVQGSIATQDGISAPLPGEVASGATGGGSGPGAAAGATAGATPPRQMMPVHPQQQQQQQQQQQPQQQPQQEQQHVAEGDSLSLDIPLLTTSAPPPASLRLYALFRHASYHMLAVVAVLFAFAVCTAAPAFLLAPNPALLAADARAAEAAAAAASAAEAASALPAGAPSEAFARTVGWHSRREEWASAAPRGEPSRVVAVTVLRATEAEAAGPMACGVFACWYYDAPRGVFESVAVADMPEDDEDAVAAARRHSHTLPAKAKKLLQFSGVAAIIGAAVAGAVLLKMILNVLLLVPEETVSDAAFGEEDGGAEAAGPAAAAATGGGSTKAVPDIIVVVNGGATEPVQPNKQPSSPPPPQQQQQQPPPPQQPRKPQRPLWRRAARRVFGRGRAPGVRTRALALLAVIAAACVALLHAGVSAAADAGSPPAPRTPFNNGASSGSVETVLQGVVGAFAYTWTNSTVREAGPGTRIVGRNASFVSRRVAGGSSSDAARVLPSALVFYMPLVFLGLLLLTRAAAGLLRRACAPQLRRFAEGGAAVAASVAAPTLPDLPPACGRASCGDRCCCRVDQLLFATCLVPTDPVAAFAAARGGKALGAAAGAGPAGGSPAAPAAAFRAPALPVPPRSPQAQHHAGPAGGARKAGGNANLVVKASAHPLAVRPPPLQLPPHGGAAAAATGSDGQVLLSAGFPTLRASEFGTPPPTPPSKESSGRLSPHPLRRTLATAGGGAGGAGGGGGGAGPPAAAAAAAQADDAPRPLGSFQPMSSLQVLQKQVEEEEEALTQPASSAGLATTRGTTLSADVSGAPSGAPAAAPPPISTMSTAAALPAALQNGMGSVSANAGSAVRSVPPLSLGQAQLPLIPLRRVDLDSFSAAATGTGTGSTPGLASLMSQSQNLNLAHPPQQAAALPISPETQGAVVSADDLQLNTSGVTTATTPTTHTTATTSTTVATPPPPAT